MTFTELNQIVERYHRAREQWLDILAPFVSKSKLTDDHLGAATRAKAKQAFPAEYEEVVAATIAFDQLNASLRLREVEAHERATAWATIRERSTT